MPESLRKSKDELCFFRYFFMCPKGKMIRNGKIYFNLIREKVLVKGSYDHNEAEKKK